MAEHGIKYQNQDASFESSRDGLCGLAGRRAGLTLGDMLKASAARSGGEAAASFGRAKSVIHIYLQGGFAHMDSFDPKPDAPLEYRGILSPISTSAR